METTASPRDCQLHPVNLFNWAHFATNQAKSAGPSLEGPPGCEAFPLSCIQCPLFLSFCIQVFSYPFIPAWLMLHCVSCIVLLAIWLLTVRLESSMITTQQAGALDLGLPQGSHENSSNFKPVSRASKVMKIGPKATQKHQKLTLKTTEFQLL